MAERTWSGTYEFGAERILTPRTVEEAQELVASSSRIRSLGTRHSFNDIADSDGELITLIDIAPEIVVDGDTVTVTGGTRYGVLARELERHGRALHNMGSLPHISVAGATATGTHGSGVTNGSLSTAVRAIERIAPDGSLWTIRRGDPGFEGAVVALGALGVATRVTFDTQSSYRMRQDVYLDLPWSTALDELEAVMAGGYSVSLFHNWVGDTIESVWVKTRLDDGDDQRMPSSYFGAHPSPSKELSPAGGHDDNTTQQGGVPGPWLERLPHFRLDATPSNGDEIQSEFFVERGSARDALLALRAFGEDIAPALLITELRTVKADDLWLSGAYQRETLAIHFTWKNQPDAVAALVPRIQQALAPFDARPHWGKVFDQSFPVQQLYPRIDDFRALVLQHDPQRKFGNGYLERVVGV